MPRPEELGIGLLFWTMRDAAIVGEARSGRIVLWNPAAERLFGYLADEVVGQSLEILVPEALRERHRSGIARFAETGHGPWTDAARPVEVPALRNGGEEIAVELTLTPIVHDRAPGRFVLALIRDVSERRGAEAAVERQARLVELAHDAIIVRDPASVIVGWNHGAQQTYGWTAAEAIGTVTHELLATRFPDTKEAVDTALLDSDRWDGELVHRRKDGSWVVVASRQVLQRDAGGQPAAILEINRDVSERKQAEEALQAANRELEAFTYSVSHDLRSPLRAVDGFSRILLDDYAEQLPDEAKRYLGRVREGAQRMGRLIDDLLDFSRVGRQPLAERLVAPESIVHQVLDELAEERAGRQVEVIIDKLPSCRADPALLQQVFGNLLSNALKFTRRRSTARIEIGSREDLARPGERVYYVRDNGAGFDMVYAEKLFGVFQRLHRAEEFEGTGVGLALVQRIVHRHGGRVWAEAAVDQGATFYVALPAAEPASGKLARR